MSDAENNKDDESFGYRLLVLVFGVYLIVGAVYTAINGKWFPGFPPQFDVIYLLGGESLVAAYIEAALVGMVGLFSVFGALFLWRSSAS